MEENIVVEACIALIDDRCEADESLSIRTVEDLRKDISHRLVVLEKAKKWLNITCPKCFISILNHQPPSSRLSLVGISVPYFLSFVISVAYSSIFYEIDSVRIFLIPIKN